MSVIGYTAVEKFGPESGDGWTKYIAWSGLHQLSQVITLDGCLCSRIINELSPEDWAHNIHQNFMTDYFWDLDYLLTRTAHQSGRQILGFVQRSIDSFPHGFNDPRFEFAGYDLLDKQTGISALLNCGGFPETFANSELNEFGLLTTFERAEIVQRDLLKNNPGEAHADCDLWALWIYLEGKLEVPRQARDDK